MRRFVVTLSILVLLGVSHPAIATEVSTADFTNPAVFNSPTINPAPICERRLSHYFIEDTGTGMLSIASQWKCNTGSGSGKIAVCQLDQTLKCRSDIQFRDKNGTPIDLSAYAVSLQGVTAKGELHPWIDPQAAATIVNKIQNPASNPVAQQEAKNQAVVNSMGGEENFKEFFMAGVCRYALVKAGVLQPTAQEAAEDEQNRKNGAKVTVNTTPEHVTTCKTTINNFCSRKDLPPSLTQTDNYKTVCGAAVK